MLSRLRKLVFKIRHKTSAGRFAESLRRAIQFNWVTSESNRRIAMLRHQASASLKRMLAMLRPGRT